MTEIVDKAPGKREARKQDRRAAILTIARRAFLSNGYSGASMSAISAELGGSKATLWNYFPSKEELFAAVLDDATADYRQQLADLLKPGEDVRTTLLQFCRSFIVKVTSPDGLRLKRLVVAEINRFPEVGEIFYRRVPLRTHEMLAGFFADAMTAGKLRADDPHYAARVLASLCMGGLPQRMMWGQQASAEELEREAELATDIFMRAFTPR